MIAALLLIFPVLIHTSNEKFFEKVSEDYKKGAVWIEVEPRQPDPNSESITLQCMDPETNVPCSEPYIIYKLTIPKN